MDKSPEKKSQLELLVQIGGLIVGLIALITTVFFSLKSDRSKELSITYGAMRPLLISESSRTTATLEVRVAGKQVAAPWLVSGRLENTGNLPIEERDIETPIQIQFDKAKVISAEVVQKNQESLYAMIGLDAGAITFNHKLLNPGDWIAFDIVLDGEPTLPPATQLRISGVSALKNQIQTTAQAKLYPTLFDLPKSLIYFLLAISSTTAAILSFLGPALIMDAIGNLFRSSPNANGRQIAIDELRTLVSPLTPKSRNSIAIHALLNLRLEHNDIDNPAHIASLIANTVPGNILSTLATDPRSAAESLCTELKENLRDKLAMQIFLKLPSESSSIQRDAMRSLNPSSISANELLERAVRIISNPSEGISARKRIDSEQVLSGALVLIVGVSIALIVGGTWRTLLGN